MKKTLLVLVLALALALSAFALVGCGGTEPEAPTDGAAADIQKIKDAGVLKVGVKSDVPGFGFLNPQTNAYEGMEIDLAGAIAEEILGDATKVEFTPVTAKTRGTLLDNGQIDIVIATFTIKPDRLEQWNFTDPYYQDTVGLLVKKDSGIKSLADLDGKKIGVAQGATTKDAIQVEADKLGIKVSFTELATYPEINTALEAGKVDAFSVDKSILAGYLNDTKEILPDGFSPQDYGMATKKTNTTLAELVNSLVNDMKTNGDIDALIEKHNLVK